VSSAQSEQQLSPEGPRRKRRLRPSEEVRTLILAAAQRCFATSGYAGATTCQIATEAGMVENLIFTNFGNTEALFDAAIVEPFRTAIEKFVERLHDRGDHTLWAIS